MNKLWYSPAGKKWADWECATSGAHTLIAGCTGSGKSVLLHDLMYNLMLSFPWESQFCLIDPKRVELYRYRNLPHTMAYCQDNEEIINTLDNVISVIDKRYRMMQAEGSVFWNRDKIYVLIDELADIMVTSRHEMLPRLQRISQLGRACGVHLICATQAPSRRVIPAELTLNFTDKICLRCDTAIESRQVIGISGGELLPLYGMAYYRSPRGVSMMDVPMTSERELAERINHWILQK